jgi:ketose-bisphosphate aldolase
MPLVTLRNVLEKATKEGYAVGAFNVFDHLSMVSVITAAAEMSSPVIVQTLPPIVHHWGARAVAGWARILSHEHDRIPVVLHLDHGHEIGVIHQCIENGWTSVMIDASRHSLEENIRLTKAVVEEAHPRGITVEGEIGAIFSVEDSEALRQTTDHLATVDSCTTYARETAVDALAPAVGTAHGLYREAPRIDYERLSRIVEALRIPVVIHGGTGLTPGGFQELIQCGARKINIATQINLEYMGAVDSYLTSHPHAKDPLDLCTHAARRIREKAMEFMGIFGSANKA